MALGAAIGIPAALLAAGFLGVVHELEHWLWGDSPAWYLILGLPVAGALIVLVTRRWLPGDGGHDPREGLSMKPTPLSHAPGIALAALGSLSFGAVLGPEAPVIALGSVVGVAATRLVRVGERETAVLSTAGSFSAMSALFGGPIVAGMLLVEGGLAMGKALLPVLLPGLVAAAIGYTVFVGLGDWGGLDAPGNVSAVLFHQHQATDEFLAITIWRTRAEAEAYDASGQAAAMAATIRHAFAAPPVLTTYEAYGIPE